jgi:hypothetical protein
METFKYDTSLNFAYTIKFLLTIKFAVRRSQRERHKQMKFDQRLEVDTLQKKK